jgi:hypothetical protein
MEPKTQTKTVFDPTLFKKQYKQLLITEEECINKSIDYYTRRGEWGQAVHIQAKWDFIKQMERHLIENLDNQEFIVKEFEAA